MTQYLYVLIGLLFLLTIMFDIQMTYTKETMDNLNPETLTQSPFLLHDVYPEETNISIHALSKYNEKAWRQSQPVQVGNYEQTTNNIQFPINPDNGTCIPREFCYKFYKNNMIHHDDNVSEMIVSDNTQGKSSSDKIQGSVDEVRIGYFRTDTRPFF